MAAVELGANVTWFGGLRYDWSELNLVAQGIQSAIEGIEGGPGKNVEKGVGKRSAESQLAFLRRFLAVKYPGLESKRGLAGLASRGRNRSRSPLPCGVYRAKPRSRDRRHTLRPA